MSGDGGTGNVRNVRRIAVRRCQECQEECQEVTGEETEMGVAHLLTGLTRFYTGRSPMDPLGGGTGKMEAAIAEGNLIACVLPAGQPREERIQMFRHGNWQNRSP